MKKLLTYEEVLQKIGEKKKLLLGNGFSMAYEKERFSFTSLLQSAIDNKIIIRDSEIHKIFQKNETSDFEEIIKILESTSNVLEIYGENEELCEKLLEDSKNLKNFLVKVIANNHPEKCNSIDKSQLLSTANFIKSYDTIYTLNYDLLLYWTTETLRNEMGEASKEFTDGFKSPDEELESDEKLEYVKFDNNSHGNTCLYLHGALHIFDAGDKIMKKTFSRTGKCLTEQIKEAIDDKKFPVFVSEGTSEQKKTKILHNAYLNHCYKSLSKIGGDLVIFGTMLKTNDTHIQEAILNSGVKNIYFGVAGLDKAKDLDEFVEKAKEAKKPKEVYFYGYKSVKIWEKEIKGGQKCINTPKNL